MTRSPPSPAGSPTCSSRISPRWGRSASSSARASTPSSTSSTSRRAPILTGGLLVSGDTLRVDARLIRVATGEVTAGHKVEGNKADFFAIEKELVDLIVAGLGVTLSFPERTALRRNATQSWEAWLAYASGLTALDAGDRDRALVHFRAALDADPRYQAAQDATERLRVLIARDVETRGKLTDALVKNLDPEAADFATQVDRIFMGLDDDSRSLHKRLVVLRWLIAHDHRPWQNGFSRVPMELIVLASRAMVAPDLRRLVPGVCEYAMTWYPDQPGLGRQCQGLLESSDRLAALDQEALRKNWAEQLATSDLPWMIALRDNYEQVRELLELAGQRARVAPPHVRPAPTPPAP